MDHRSPAATPPARTASSESPISRKPTPDNVRRAATHTCGSNKVELLCNKAHNNNNYLVRVRGLGVELSGLGLGFGVLL